MGVAANLPALQVMGAEFYIFMSPTVAAFVTVTPQDILPDIVIAEHLTFLIVFALRNRFSFRDSFNKLQVEFGSLNNYLAYRQ